MILVKVFATGEENIAKKVASGFDMRSKLRWIIHTDREVMLKFRTDIQFLDQVIISIKRHLIGRK